MDVYKQYIIPSSTEVILLDCANSFQNLSKQEKLYSHFLAQASFQGGLIVLFQTSAEAPGIFLLLQKLFRAQSPSELSELALSVGFSQDEVEAFLIYGAAFYSNMGNYKSNMGNYKSFGGTKFIPDVNKWKLIKSSKTYKQDASEIEALWNAVNSEMFSLKHKELSLGEKGISTYYSDNCDESDAKIAQEFLDAKINVGTMHFKNIYGMDKKNTRLFKKINPNTGEIEYEIRVASAETNATNLPGYVFGESIFVAKDIGKGFKFSVTRGDYSPLMYHVVKELKNAQVYASNGFEKDMLGEYIKSFSSGSILAHKDGSRQWIKNKGPIVEIYIGFIESYRDPYGVRGEFEGFVAVVNKDMSAKFSSLVNNAEKLLAHLPWPAEYEKDKFLWPDFTSLDVLAFGGSGIPAGINIPNCDDIRQYEGFKNVSLGNVLTSGYKDSKVTFLRDKDKELYSKYKIQSFEVQVGLHELLGHGSGKLFIEEEPGQFNFDKNTVTHTETKEKITSWYKSGETWDSKFSTIASTYEECRAECVGIYLCIFSDVQRIFGHTDDEADDIIYINWLNMVRAGLLALEFYSPETKSWRQAHMNARFVILRVLIEAGEDLVKIEKVPGDDGKPDLIVTLDRAKIISVGKPVIGAFLRKLQVFKSTADVETARNMYHYYSDVNNQQEPKFWSLRDIVLDRKQPRTLFVQHHTYIEDGVVKLKSYDPSASGLIQSFVDRFNTSDIDAVISQLWGKEKHFLC